MKALGNDKISEGVVRNSDPLDNSRPYQTGGQLLNSSTTKISQRLVQFTVSRSEESHQSLVI